MSSEQRPRRLARGPRRATVGVAVMGIAALGASTGTTLAQGAAHHPAAHHAASSHHKKHKTASKPKKKPAVGSDLGALDITATSAAIQMPLYSHTGEEADADIPYSLATLGTGGIGNALSSILYPGPTGAHGGDAVALLGLPLPKNVSSMLNDPEIAQAQTGVGAKTNNLSHPGLTMTATATATNVSAETTAAGNSVPVVGPIVGGTTAKSSIKITGPRTVTVNSTSTVHNITIAKVIKIGSVTSTTHAVTNGHTSSGAAKTTVAGVTIAGVHVGIDNKGIEVPGKTLPIVGNTAAKLVNTALKTAGVHLDVTKSTKKVKGPHTQVTAGVLEIHLGNSNYTANVNDTGKLVTVGGASIDAQARPGFPPPPPIKTPPTPKPVKSAPVTNPGNPGTPGTPGTPGVPGTTSTGVTAPTDPGGAVVAAPPTALVSNPVSLPGGLHTWWLIIGLLGAGLFAFGMKRLPDQVLQTAGTTCSLEE